MSHLENVQSLAAADCERVKELIAGIEATKASAEETVSGFEAVGAEGKAAEAAGLTDQLEGAQATAESTIAIFEAIHAQAEALKTGGQAGTGATVTVESDGSFTVSGEIPRSQWKNEVGESLEAPEDLEEPRDVGKSKSQRFLNILNRNASRVENQAKDTAKSSFTSGNAAFSPPQGQTYETVRYEGQPSMGPTPAPHASVEDAVGSFVLLTATVAHAVNYYRNRKKDKDQ